MGPVNTTVLGKKVGPHWNLPNFLKLLQFLNINPDFVSMIDTVNVTLQAKLCLTLWKLQSSRKKFTRNQCAPIFCILKLSREMCCPPPCSLNRNKVLVDCWLAVSSGAVTLRYCPQLQLIFLLYKAQPRPHRPTILSGIFFVLPCIESYQKVDLRTITLGVPPQEVSVSHSLNCQCYWCWMSPQGADQGQRDGVCGGRGLLQDPEPGVLRL